MLKKIRENQGIALIVLVSIHFLFLIYFFHPAISTPDAQGYFTQAKLIATEGKTHLSPGSVVQYIGPHWYPNGKQEYYATFPPGFPIMLAFAYLIAGYKGAIFLNILLASVCLIMLYLLGGRMMGRTNALLLVFLFMLNPVFNEHALFADSHIALLLFLVCGLYFYHRFSGERSSQHAILSGFFMGSLPSIRYADAMIAIGFAVFVLIMFIRRKHKAIDLVLIGTGFLIPVLLLMIHNHLAFGQFFKTAYDLPENQPVFGLDYFLSYSGQYLVKLMNEGVGILFLPGVAGMVYLVARKETRETGLLILLLVLPVSLLYMSYCWPPDPQSMRFLLPTLPFYLISGIIFLDSLAIRDKLARVIVISIILGFTIVSGLPDSTKRLNRVALNNRILSGVTQAVRENIEEGSVIVAPEGINQQLDLIGEWKLVDINILHTSLNPAITGPIASIPPGFRCRNKEADKKYVKFRFLLGKNVHNVFAWDTWNWAGDSGKVYLLGYEQTVDYFRKNLPDHHSITEKARIELLPYLTNDTMQIAKPRPFTMPGFRHTGFYDLYVDGSPLIIADWEKWKE